MEHRSETLTAPVEIFSKSGGLAFQITLDGEGFVTCVFRSQPSMQLWRIPFFMFLVVHKMKYPERWHTGARWKAGRDEYMLVVAEDQSWGVARNNLFLTAAGCYFTDDMNKLLQNNRLIVAQLLHMARHYGATDRDSSTGS